MKGNSENNDDDFFVKAYRQTGEQRYLLVLFERYQHLILGLAIKQLKSANEAKDLCSEVYELISIKLLKHDVNHFKSWLYRVVFNCTLQRLKKRSSFVSINETDFFDEESMDFTVSDHPKVKAAKIDDEIHDCIDQLKHEQKNCIELFYLQEFCYNEIAEQTGYLLKKVKSYIQNGKRNLKLCLENKL